jgi:putative membrane-bound dehydrogenase-like protein
MRSLRCLLVGLLFLGVGHAAHTQVPPEKSVSTFKVVEPLELALWAAEPLFVNPTSFDIDHLGRCWVCEAVNYRAKANPPLRPEGDRIVILEDSKGTGKADKATVFYQGKDLQAPLGIAVAKDPVGPGYKVYVCQSPDILVFTDKEGKGKADGPPTKLLSGFGGHNHDHGVHGLLIGPDGKFYFSVGDTGVNKLQSADKKGRVWSSNNTDCRAGTIWRCNMDGTGLEQIAHNFRNEYEPCVDSFGTVFVSDNDDDGSQQTRICYVMPGGNYGYHPRGPGHSHWHEESPGVVPKILRTFFGSPTGMVVYEGKLLPEKYQSQPLHTDAGPRHVRCYHLKPNGAGYDVDREDMVNSTDTWFRPSDICVAPDGSVFVADWYDPGVGGHGMGDWTRGRIYRIAPKGNKPAVPAVVLNSKEGILAALGSPNLAVRYLAMAKLGGMEQKEAIDILEAGAVQKDNPWLRARALWHLAQRGRLRFVNGAFEDKDPNFRLLAMRALKDFQGYSPADYTPEWKAALLKDNAAIRREALLLLRDVDPEKARPLIYELAKQYDGKDRFYLCAIGIAVGHHDKARRDVVLKDFAKAFPGWNETIAGLVWELRPPGVLPELEKRLVDATLSAEQRGQIVDILSAGEDTTGGMSLLRVLRTSIPADVRDKIIASLKQNLPGKWKALRGDKDLTAAIEQLLGGAETRLAALALIGAAEKADSAGKVADIAKDAKEKPALRTQAIQTLGTLPAVEAVTALEGLLKANAALRADVVAALGKQAAQQNQKLPSVAPALKALQGVVTAKDQGLPVQVAAVTALTGAYPGTVWLLDLHDKNELPEALKPEAARLLRNTPFKDLRARANAAFPPRGKIDPKKLPSQAVLATRVGNAEKGKKLIAASANSDLQCLKCHTIQGVGGNVGPDLSMIGKKASKENLHESILLPSKAIADQYLTWIIETKAGLVITGLIVEDTPEHLLLRDANGKDTKIAKKDIESRAKDPKSLMPENIVAFMSEDELVDIVEYLFTLRTAVLGMDYWHIVGPFDLGHGDAGLDKEFPPEKAIDLKASYDGKTGKVTWKTVKPNAQGYVDLQQHYAGHSDQIVSYLYREIESPADQDATVQIGTDDGGKLWVNGALVYTNRKHEAAKPAADSVKVKLKKGKNTVLLKITNGDGAHGFYFMLLAEEELKRVASR